MLAPTVDFDQILAAILIQLNNVNPLPIDFWQQAQDMGESKKGTRHTEVEGRLQRETQVAKKNGSL